MSLTLQTPLQTPRTALYIPALTGIRIIAAYLVFFHHFNPLSSSRLENKFLAFINPVFEEGHIGVSIFFVLSGLLITLRYYERLEITRSWLFRYLRNRFARIYPLFFIITCLTLTLFFIAPKYAILKENPAFTGSQWVVMALANFTLTKGLFSSLKFTGIAQGWTLTVEESFYLSAPLLLLGLRSNRNRIFLYPFVVMLIGITLYFRGVDSLNELADNAIFFFSYTFFGRCFEFLCGMFLGLQFIKRPDYGVRHSTLLTYGGMVWILCCIYAQDFVKGSELISTHTMLGAIINNFILPIGIGGLLLGLAKGNTIAGRVLSTRMMQLLGKSSYAFYLIHLGVINILIDQFIKSNFFLNFLIINSISILAYKFIEEPLHRRLKA